MILPHHEYRNLSKLDIASWQLMVSFRKDKGSKAASLLHQSLARPYLTRCPACCNFNIPHSTISLPLLSLYERHLHWSSGYHTQSACIRHTSTGATFPFKKQTAAVKAKSHIAVRLPKTTTFHTLPAFRNACALLPCLFSEASRFQSHQQSCSLRRKRCFCNCIPASIAIITANLVR